MSAYWLAETTVKLIEEQIKANIASALTDVRSERNDPIVSTEVPKEYFIYEDAKAYRAPAVFTLIRNQNFMNPRGANHINAQAEVLVAVVVEDRLAERVTKKAWRYQAALASLLHEAILTSSDEAVRLFIRVRDCHFSGIVDLKNDKQPDAVFRKEVSLKLEVDHMESLV